MPKKATGGPSRSGVTKKKAAKGGAAKGGATRSESARTARSRAADGRAGASGGRLGEIGDSASKVVRQAASVLEEELAAGIAAARRIEKRFEAERRLDEGDVEEIVDRFRATAHELVEVVGDRIAELGSEETQELAKRFVGDAHGALDAVADLARFAPELVDRLAKRGGRGETQAEDGAAGRRTRRPPRG